MPNGYYRLSPETSHKAQFWLLTFVALFVNGIVGTIMFQSASDSGGDDAPWWILVIFLLIGLALTYAAIKSFLRWMMVGETHVDVNTATATPGQMIEILVSQPGRFAIEQMRVDFICQEKATYRRGTDTHTKTEMVREEMICDLTGMTAREGKVLAHQAAQVPSDAMPSFEASNNKITWLIRVKMVLPGRPDVEQCFPLLVVSQPILNKVGTLHG